MADCFSLPNAAEKISLSMNAGARAIEQNKRLHGVYYCIDPLGEAKDIAYLEAATVLRQAADAIEALLAENAKLKAERDAAVAEVEELNDDFVECVCSGYGNLSPYCGNRCSECVDKRGWCKEVTKYCRGFIPMSYKDWRGTKEEENATD